MYREANRNITRDERANRRDTGESDSNFTHAIILSELYERRDTPFISNGFDVNASLNDIAPRTDDSQVYSYGRATRDPSSISISTSLELIITDFCPLFPRASHRYPSIIHRSFSLDRPSIALLRHTGTKRCTFASWGYPFRYDARYAIRTTSLKFLRFLSRL